MPQFNPPIKNSAYSFPAFLRSQADSTVFVSNATVGTVDVSISTEFGSWASLTNVPAPAPAAGKQLMVSLSAAEMNADNITILFSDVAGAQWFDRAYNFQTVVGASWSTFNSSNDSVGLKAITHSGATIKGIENYANISNVTLHAGVHSGATVQINSIAPGSYSAVSFSVRDGGLASTSGQASWFGAADLATDAGQEIADRLLARSIQGGADGNRTVTSAMRVLRNRVTLSGLTGTVYEEDNATSAFTFSLTTVNAVAIDHVQPGGV